MSFQQHKSVGQRRHTGHDSEHGTPSVLARFRAKAPDIVGWVAFFAGVWSILAFFLRHWDRPMMRTIQTVFDLLNVVAGPSLFTAGLMMVFASAAFRRKRITIMLIIALQSATVALYALVLVLMPEQWHDLTSPDMLASVAICLALILWAIWVRKEFPSRLSLRSLLRALGVFLAGEAVVYIVALLAAFTVVPRHGHHFPHAAFRFWWSLEATFSFSSFTGHVPHGAPNWLATLISFASLSVLILALYSFLHTQPGTNRSEADDLHLHTLLARYPADSLSYFTTGNHRSLVFSRDGNAAISYCVSFGVALAGGDPVGDPASWDDAIDQFLKFAHTQGLTPSAISVSERGARAWKRHGMRIMAMGDEAVIDAANFSTGDPKMKPLLAAQRRVARSGVEISCRRVRDIPAAELEFLRTCAQRYRVGEERGFSMSLDRILDPMDAEQMVVTAYEQGTTVGGEPHLHALLVFAPWGKRSLSLNLMRRNPVSANGVIEAMVLALIDHCKRTGLEKISLNFAMFRSMFVEGEAVDATFVQRGLRRVMILASKFWQLESLYESNARYNPEWVPRYLAYPTMARLTATTVAAGRLEGFLPAWGEHLGQMPAWLSSPEHRAQVIEIHTTTAEDVIISQRLTDQQKVRLRKAEALQAAGMDCFPPAHSAFAPVPVAEIVAQMPTRREGVKETSALAPTPELWEGAPYGTAEEIALSGRISGRRRHGGVIFIDVMEGDAKIQLVCERDTCENFSLLRFTDTGDVIAVRGRVGYSKRGQLSVFVGTWWMLAKALRPVLMPGKVLDPQMAVRERTMEFINTPRAMELLRMRSVATSKVREILSIQGYCEVETPVLQAVKGGANARPFVTHINAYNAEVTLRIAPELYLKRLVVGGMEAVFEMGRSFRNEGADRTHNPEFTSLEAYRAGGDYVQMRELTEDLIRACAVAVHGRPVVWVPRATVERFASAQVPVLDEVLPEGVAEQFGPVRAAAYREAFAGATAEMVPVDITAAWPVISVCDAVSKAVGQAVSMDSSVEELLEICAKHEVEPPAVASTGTLINELYEELVEGNTAYPTFYTDFPAEVCPLTRKHREDPRLAERWDLVAFGMELGTAYTELTDPRDQRERFVQQSLAAAAGDPEAMSVDEDFLSSLELGLVPTGGMGMGIDRMLMFITGTSIREVLPFPFVKPLRR